MRLPILILAVLAIARTATASADNAGENGPQAYAGAVTTTPASSTIPHRLMYDLTPVLAIGSSFEHPTGSGVGLSWGFGADMDIRVGKYLSTWGTFRTVFDDQQYYGNAGSQATQVGERDIDLGAGGAVHPFACKAWPFDLSLKAGTRFFILNNDLFTTWGGGVSLGGAIRVDLLKYLYLIADADWTYNAFHPGDDSDLGSLNRLGGPRAETTYSGGLGFRAGPHATISLGFEGTALQLRDTTRYYSAVTMSFILRF